MFQQLINPIKLEAVTNLTNVTNVLHNRIFCESPSFSTQSRNGITLSPEIRKSVSYEDFENSLLKFIRSTPNRLFNVSDTLGIKHVTRLSLGLSQS